MKTSAAACREARIARFFALASHLPRRPLRVLDVGGTVGFWAGRRPEWMHVTLLNVMPQESADNGIDATVGDARDLSRWPDGAFDVAFSNSVIGHVGGWGDQQRMAGELQRVARYVYLQTPNHRFPLDWRTLVPAFHWLPACAQAALFRSVRVGTYRRAQSWKQAMRWATRIRNLKHDELRSIFPGATIERERVGGFTKSFVVHSFRSLNEGEAV